MIPVAPGKEARAAAHGMLAEAIRIASGAARVVIPFNGGRDDRQDQRAAAVRSAISVMAPAVVIGCMATIGGPSAQGRGRRYVKIDDDGRVTLAWVNWRRSKRMARRYRLKFEELSKASGFKRKMDGSVERR